MKKGWIIITAIIIVLIAIRLVLPYFVKNYVNNVLADLDGYRGSVRDVDLDLYRGAYVIKGITIVKTGDSIPVPFVDVARIDLSVHWKAIFNGSVAGEVILESPVVNFAVTEGDDPGSTNEKISQDGSGIDWTKTLDNLMPLRINHFEVKNGKISYKDFSTKPQVDISISDLFLVATNLSNVQDKSQKLPSTLHIRGTSLGGGLLDVKAKLNILRKIPDFDMDLKFEGVDLTALNSFIKAYTKADVEKGTFSLYSELTADDGNLNGYMKPVVEDLKILEWDKEEGGFFQKVWESIVGGITEIFKNHPHDQFATQVTIRGDLNNMNVGTWQAILNIFKNAFIQALSKQVDDSVNFSGEKKD